VRVIGRLLLALAIALPVSWVVAVGVAAGDASGGPLVVKCMHWQDAMRISPGVSNSPSSQSVSAHGKLFACNKAGGGAVFNATLSMSNATCSNIAMSGSAQFDWVNGSHSSAFLVFQSQALEPRKVVISGTVTSGNYQGLIVRAELRFTQVFSGSGPNCSPGNLLQKIDFTNTQSFKLLTPNTQPTTSNPGTTTPHTNPPTTSPGGGTVPHTVPVTNQGAPPPTQPTKVIIINRFPRRRLRHVIVVNRPFPRGTLAFTGSSSGKAALFGLEALLIGGALACLDPDRARRVARMGRRGRFPKKFLRVTLPPR
jgi:hypothetical protein